MAGYRLEPSTTSASVFPSTTSAEAPKKLPPTSRVTAADAECLEFLETAASMLILASPAGVLIHRGGRTPELSLVEPVSSLADFYELTNESLYKHMGRQRALKIILMYRLASCIPNHP